MNAGDRFRTRESLNVICWWWYDTVAILDDYSDNCEAVLPAGESFTIEQIPDNDPARVLCRLDNARILKSKLISKDRLLKPVLLCKPSPYSVELSRTQISTFCEPLNRQEAT